MQLTLVALLHTQLADVLGAPVIAGVVLFFNAFFFFGVDAPDVAHHVAGQFTVRVLPK